MQNPSQEKHFCTQCGKSLEPGARFCGSCGLPLKAPEAASDIIARSPAVSAQAEPAPRPAAFGEAVTGAFLASRKKGLFSIESFHVIVTPGRVILAAFTNEMVKQAAKEAGQTGFFSGIVGAATVGFTYYKKYLNMDPEAVLKENPQNFAIQRSNIRKVKLEMGSKHRDPKTKRETWDEDKLEIEAGEKFSFRIPHQLSDQARDVLSRGKLV
jgi:hypothetical protein